MNRTALAYGLKGTRKRLLIIVNLSKELLHGGRGGQIFHGTDG